MQYFTYIIRKTPTNKQSEIGKKYPVINFNKLIGVGLIDTIHRINRFNKTSARYSYENQMNNRQ